MLNDIESHRYRKPEGAAPMFEKILAREPVLRLDQMLIQPLRGPASGGALASRKDTQ